MNGILCVRYIKLKKENFSDNNLFVKMCFVKILHRYDFRFFYSKKEEEETLKCGLLFPKRDKNCEIYNSNLL